MATVEPLDVLKRMTEYVGTNWDGDTCPICLAEHGEGKISVDGCDHEDYCPWLDALRVIGVDPSHFRPVEPGPAGNKEGCESDGS